MARFNRYPAYDLQRHIVTGERGPLSGDDNLRKYDAELDREDPMQFGGDDNFVVPLGASVIDAANRAQAVMLDSGRGDPGEPIQMSSASDCNDEPTKGGLVYGPRNTGGY